MIAGSLLRQRLAERPLAERLATKLRVLRQRLAERSSVEWLALPARHAIASLRTLKRAVRRKLFGIEAPKPTPALREGLSEAEREVIRASYRAIARYRPKRYSGRVLLLRTGSHLPEPITRERLPLDGWDGLLSGPVSVVNFACQHLDLMQEPVMSRAAEKMAAFLREADRDPPDSRAGPGG